MPPPSRRLRALAPALAVLAVACQRDASLGRHVDHPEFDADVAWGFLTEQVAFGPRYAPLKSHDRALAWLVEQLGFRADSVATLPFAHVTPDGKTATMTDVLGRWNPGAPRRILLVAHWDTHPRADESADPGDRRYPVPGANGGAAGTALLMTLAQALHEQRPSVGVDLLFTDGDDYANGVYAGTEAYLHSPFANPRPAFALVLGVVADRDAWLPEDAGSRRHARAVVRRVWGIARQLGKDSVFVPQPYADSAGAHLALARAGIPAVLVNDPELGPGNSYWHTVRDLPSTASRETLALVGTVVAEVVYRGVPQDRP